MRTLLLMSAFVALTVRSYGDMRPITVELSYDQPNHLSATIVSSVPTEARTAVSVEVAADVLRHAMPIEDGILAIIHCRVSVPSKDIMVLLKAISENSSLDLEYIQIGSCPSGLDTWNDRVKRAETEEAIVRNLRKIAAAADKYFVQNAVTQVTLDDLLRSEKHTMNLNSIAGEDYFSLVIRKGEAITVTTGRGITVNYKP